MDDLKSITGASVGVFATIGQVTTQNINLIMSVTCAILAATASVYAIIVSRDTMRRRRAEDEHACELCDGTGRDCPYPSDARPVNCRLKK